MPRASWPTAILVDLDNTLHDYRAAARDLRSALARHVERQWGVPSASVLERYEQLVAEDADGVFETGRELRLSRMRLLLGTWPETRRAEPAALADFIETTLLDAVRAFDGAIEACRAISSQVRTMVVTEGYQDTQGAIAQRLGLSVDPRAFLATKAYAVRKSDGSAFLLARERLGVAADEIVMVGDNWGWDIKGAALAGMWQLWVAPDGDDDCGPPPERHLGRVRTFREVPAFLARSWARRNVSSPGR